EGAGGGDLPGRGRGQGGPRGQDRDGRGRRRAGWVRRARRRARAELLAPRGRPALVTETERASLREALHAALARASVLMDAVRELSWLLDGDGETAARPRVLVAVNAAAD